MASVVVEERSRTTPEANTPDESDHKHTPAGPPPKPDPSKDPAIIPFPVTPGQDGGTPTPPGSEDPLNIFTLQPVVALKMMCRGIAVLSEDAARAAASLTETPELLSHVDKSLLRQQEHISEQQQNAGDLAHAISSPPPHVVRDIHNDAFPKTPIGSPELASPDLVTDNDPMSEPSQIQTRAIIRKFYSKKPPPITLESYLLRIHRYCPTSTAVYLAASLYVYRLAVVERVIVVSPRNVHRLLLASLRIAMKALEDLSYPHRRFSKVGGVTELELGKLEISFCFLMNFELQVTAEMLSTQAEYLRHAMTRGIAADSDEFPSMSEMATSLPVNSTTSRPVMVDV